MLSRPAGKAACPKSAMFPWRGFIALWYLFLQCARAAFQGVTTLKGDTCPAYGMLYLELASKLQASCYIPRTDLCGMNFWLKASQIAFVRACDYAVSPPQQVILQTSIGCRFWRFAGP